MLIAKVEYGVKAEFADRNMANIRAFLPEVRRRLQPGSSYSVSTSADGLSFLHLFSHEDEAEEAMLGEIPAFKLFLDELFGGGCEGPPAISHHKEI